MDDLAGCRFEQISFDLPLFEAKRRFRIAGAVLRIHGRPI